MADNLGHYYQDHWAEVDSERMARYEAMFQWRDGHEALIAPAEVAPGQVVVDYGCGPGALSVELARRVGEMGQIIALDINQDFLAKSQTLAQNNGLGTRIETRVVEGEDIPVDDQSVDRVLCKNVLEYVPDPETTIREFHRILKPGGIAHVSDSDWGAVVLEPLGDRFTELMAAASIAFRTPLIGRKLYGIFRKVGFKNIRVQVLTTADTVGGLRPVLHNMASYARVSDRLSEEKIASFLEDTDRAIEDETYLALLPQFLVTAEA
jgi:ubiquinone/menaquinone biosynthesis C-methylase UbiE